MTVDEWVRQHQPRAFSELHRDPLAGHFVLGEDLEDLDVIDRHARQSGINLGALHVALADGSTIAAVKQAEMTGPKYGVQGTPAWLISHELISGLLSAAQSDRLAQYASKLPR